MYDNVKWNREKVLNMWRKPWKIAIESQNTSWNLSVIRNQSYHLSVQINISWFIPNWWPIKRCLITKASHKKHLKSESKELSQDRCNLIVAEHTDGTGYRRISKFLNVPAVTHKWKAHHFTINRPQSSASRKISDRGVKQIIRGVVQEPRTTCRELQKDLEVALVPEWAKSHMNSACN